MLYAVLPDDVELRIGQQGHVEAVAGFVRGGFLDRVLAQGDEADAVVIKV